MAASCFNPGPSVLSTGPFQPRLQMPFKDAERPAPVSFAFVAPLLLKTCLLLLMSCAANHLLLSRLTCLNIANGAKGVHGFALYIKWLIAKLIQIALIVASIVCYRRYAEEAASSLSIDDFSGSMFNRFFTVPSNVRNGSAAAFTRALGFREASETITQVFLCDLELKKIVSGRGEKRR